MTTQQELIECIKRCEEKSISWWPAHDLKMLLEAAKQLISPVNIKDGKFSFNRDEEVKRLMRVVSHKEEIIDELKSILKDTKTGGKSIIKDTWQPIETAPRDGGNILAYNPAGLGYNGQCGEACENGGVCVSRWYSGRWELPHCCDGVSYIEPTHWMPLPQPPEE